MIMFLLLTYVVVCFVLFVFAFVLFLSVVFVVLVLFLALYLVLGVTGTSNLCRVPCGFVVVLPVCFWTLVG